MCLNWLIWICYWLWLWLVCCYGWFVILEGLVLQSGCLYLHLVFILVCNFNCGLFWYLLALDWLWVLVWLIDVSYLLMLCDLLTTCLTWVVYCRFVWLMCWCWLICDFLQPYTGLFDLRCAACWVFLIRLVVLRGFLFDFVMLVVILWISRSLLWIVCYLISFLFCFTCFCGYLVI